MTIPGQSSSLLGFPVHVSPYAVTWQPNRLHKHRRNQTQAYHRRVQKKWTKRFGVHEEPCAYVIGVNVLGAHGELLVINPQHAAMLKGAS